MRTFIIADSGSTKTTWMVVQPGKKKKIIQTPGLSPYFLTEPQIVSILQTALLPKIKGVLPQNVFFYGTGCGNIENEKMLAKALKKVFPKAGISVKTDILGAARGLCGSEKGVVSILGTGSSVCYYNGKKIANSRPGLGYVLGDEGSGSYLGKKVLHYYLNNTFEPELMDAFRQKYPASNAELLNAVYRGAFPNRYLASFAPFLSENRGHFMIENIIEDGLNDFFYFHLCKMNESWKLPIHFVGGVAYNFRDIIRELCINYEFQLGHIIKSPIDGLADFHFLKK